MLSTEDLIEYPNLEDRYNKIKDNDDEKYNCNGGYKQSIPI